MGRDNWLDIGYSATYDRLALDYILKRREIGLHPLCSAWRHSCWRNTPVVLLGDAILSRHRIIFPLLVLRGAFASLCHINDAARQRHLVERFNSWLFRDIQIHLPHLIHSLAVNAVEGVNSLNLLELLLRAILTSDLHQVRGTMILRAEHAALLLLKNLAC